MTNKGIKGWKVIWVVVTELEIKDSDGRTAKIGDIIEVEMNSNWDYEYENHTVFPLEDKYPVMLLNVECSPVRTLDDSLNKEKE